MKPLVHHQSSNRLAILNLAGSDHLHGLLQRGREQLDVLTRLQFLVLLLKIIGQKDVQLLG